MTTTAHKLPTLTTTSNTSTSAYSECGAGGQRQLTIRFAPSNVLMIVGRRTIELQEETWEYCFTSDTALELRFVGTEPITGFVRSLGSTTTTSLTGLDGALHFSCTRPASDDQDLHYEFVFGRGTTSGTTAQGVDRRPLPDPAAGAPGKPLDIVATSAQPTLIIRAKRSCPTGVTKPTVEA